MRAAWFPQTKDLAGNPYWQLLQSGLERQGVEFETTHNSYWLAGRWLWQHKQRVDVLHFHFIQPHYAGPKGRVSFKRLLKFAAYLLLARWLGYRIVWTMHDLLPSWPMPPRWLERLGRYLMAWLAHDVVVHCNEARRLLAGNFGRNRRVWVLPHPSYAAVYPNNIPCQPARARLNIEADRFVVTFLGGIRPNKGIEKLIAAFRQLAHPNAVLVIAGKPWPPQDYVTEIAALAAADPRILLKAEDVPDDELQLYINAANVLAFPFEHVLTSGSVILAMSFGRPVIAPCMGCLPELINTDAGITYNPNDPAGLVNALQQAAELDLAQMGAVAQRVNAVSWPDLARETVKIYQAGRG